MNALKQDGGGPLDSGSSFSPTMVLLPRRIRPAAVELYGALRTIDDLVDAKHTNAEKHVAAAERWSETLEASTPETEVFSVVHRGFGMEPRLVGDFCRAMRHDLASNTFETEGELDTYCANVAGAVGAMFAQVAGAQSTEAEHLARTLGKAIQLTHILRDIDVDSEEGRTYIPRESIKRFGSLDPSDRADLMRHFITRADAWFDEGLAGVDLLPIGRRWVLASAGLYRETLRQIERDGYGKSGRHSTLSFWKARVIVARAVVAPGSIQQGRR